MNDLVIKIKIFGQILSGRDDAREAFLSLSGRLKKGQKVVLDFENVFSLSPSWIDEFLKNLKNEIGIDRIYLVNIKDNEPVLETIIFLEKINNEKYNIE